MAKGKINQLQQKAIGNLLVCDSLQEAADATGITSRTLYNWQQQPVFAAAYREARQQVLSDTIKGLQSVSGATVDTLHNILMNSRSDGAKIQACRLILEMSLKGFILENVIADIDEIKAQLQEEHSERRYY